VNSCFAATVKRVSPPPSTRTLTTWEVLVELYPNTPMVWSPLANATARTLGLG
jgi:hypothetical protein